VQHGAFARSAWVAHEDDALCADNHFLQIGGSYSASPCRTQYCR
jgi:hypothetical protein